MNWLTRRRVIFRSLVGRNWRRAPLRSSLNVAAVALGVAVVVAIRIANRQAVAGFRQMVYSSPSSAPLRIEGASPLPVSLLARLRPLESQAEFIPYSRFSVWDAIARRPLTLLALDFAAVASVTGRPSFSLDTWHRQNLASGKTVSLWAGWLSSSGPAPIWLSTDYGRRYHEPPGQVLRVSLRGRWHSLRVAGWLRQKHGSRDETLALLPLFRVSGWLGSSPRVGRPSQTFSATFGAIAIYPARRTSLPHLAARIAARLPRGVWLDTPAARLARRRSMLRAFRFNLQALSLVTLLVGWFLIYNTLSMAVVRRRPGLALLRALGADRLAILSVFWVEGLIYGALGGVIGLGLGWWLAQASSRLVERTARNLYGAAGTARLQLHFHDLFWAAGLALATGWLASLAPAFEAARVPPAAGLRAGAAETAARESHSHRLLAAFTLAALGIFAARLPAWRGLPLGGYASAVCAVLAMALALFAMVDFLLARGRDRLLAAGALTPALACAGLVASLRRTALLIAALVTAVGVMVGVAIMVGSFRRTVQSWIRQDFSADVFIHTLDWSPSDASYIPRGAVQRILSVPGICRARALDSLPYRFGNRSILLTTVWGLKSPPQGARDCRSASRPALLQGHMPQLLARAVNQPFPVLVSEPFARAFHLWAGDDLIIAAPRRRLRLRIAGVFYDYSSQWGILRLPVKAFAAGWGRARPTNIELYAARGIPAATLRKQVLFSMHAAPSTGMAPGARNTAPRLGDAGLGAAGLVVHDHRWLRRQILHVFDQTFRITYALEWITLLIALLGVGNSLLATILERERELGILRLLGATRSRLLRLLLWEATFIGALAVSFGLPLGLILAEILIHVVNVQAFGWTIRLAYPVRFLAGALATVWLATLAAGWMPARLAARIAPAEAALRE